jgi:hypothetical protein
MPHRRARRVRLGAAAVLAVVFGAGLAVGAAVDSDPTATAPSAGSFAREPGRGNPPPSGWIIDRLDLTPEQEARVDSVVSHYGRHMSDLQTDYRPRFRSVVDSTNRALMEILTPDQRVLYDSIQSAGERRRSHGDSSTRR